MTEKRPYTYEDVWNLYMDHGTVDAVAEALGVPRHEVSPIIDEMPLRQFYRHKGSAPTVYTDKQLKAVLREAAKVCGEPLTLPAYHKAAPKHGWPAALTITSRLGTWEEACKKAKVKVNKSTGPRKGSITVEKCLVALRVCRADLISSGEIPEGIEPSYERYVKWARANKQPSGPTVRAKVAEYLRELGEEPKGAWRKAIKMAYGED